MPGPITSETSVTYTVRELFERQDGKLDEILGHLDNKADKTELIAVAARVEKLEQQRLDDSAVATYKRRVWKIVAIVSGIVAPAAGALVYVIH